MSDLNRRQRDELDNYITGHYGEDQFRGSDPEPDDETVDATYESDEEGDDLDLEDDRAGEEDEDLYYPEEEPDEEKED